MDTMLDYDIVYKRQLQVTVGMLLCCWNYFFVFLNWIPGKKWTLRYKERENQQKKNIEGCGEVILFTDTEKETPTQKRY